MSTPAAYAKMEADKAERSRIASAKAKVQHDEKRAEERVLYEKIRRALHPYTKCELSGWEGKYDVRVKYDNDKMQCYVYLDGNHFVTFEPERHYYHCACENVCEHEVGTWVTLDVTEHRGKGGMGGDGDYGSGFNCDVENFGDEAAFASAMADLVRDYEWSGWHAKAKKK